MLQSKSKRSGLAVRSTISSVSPRAQAWLIYIVLGVLLILTAYYVVPYVFTLSDPNRVIQPDNTKTNKLVLDVSGGDDPFYGMNIAEGFGTEEVNLVKEALTKLTEDEQKEVCASINSLVNGYRSLFSGAAFKFTEFSKDSGEFFLFGPDMRVVQVANDGTSALTLAIKNESPLQQLFKREVATKDNTGKDIASGGETCYIFTPKNTPDMALQYEHEHLSLRPIVRTIEENKPMPFIGQCFLRFKATEDELNAQALATGLSIPSMGARHLQPMGSNSVNTIQGFRTNSELERMTRELDERARTPAMRDYAEYQNKTGGPQAEVGQQGNPFANNPIQLNIDLGSVMGRDGFQDNDARNPENGGTSVRALLDKYTSSMISNGDNNVGNSVAVSDKDLAINKAYTNGMGGSGIFGENAGPLGCPSIDRTKYYTERQLAQCAGCTPDTYMRMGSRV